MSARVAARFLATSAICRRRMSAAAEHGLALLNERAHRVSIIISCSAMYVVGCLQIETVVDLPTHGAVEIFLHVPIGDARTACQPTRNFSSARRKLIRFTDPIGEPQPQRFLRAHSL